ncbi:hypothetical protein [uncultured Cetobacterium sp.]|uniref:hypothetical protein n=1 Tax=uncultured Cetobacterium sp. TaxID=527638 RepID=UPI0026253680|nr:hypothetical protein [uncultured Cetobacterium sp.]
MKKILSFIFIFTTLISSVLFANPNKGNKHHKNFSQEDNWGHNRTDFDDWLNLHPRFKHKDRKRLEKFYKDQLKEEKRLRKSFERYHREIATLPAYRNYNDPLKYFINDFLYYPNRVNGHNFSRNFRDTLTKEQKITSDFINLISNFF